MSNLQGGYAFNVVEAVENEILVGFSRFGNSVLTEEVVAVLQQRPLQRRKRNVNGLRDHSSLLYFRVFPDIDEPNVSPRSVYHVVQTLVVQLAPFLRFTGARSVGWRRFRRQSGRQRRHVDRLELRLSKSLDDLFEAVDDILGTIGRHLLHVLDVMLDDVDILDGGGEGLRDDRRLRLDRITDLRGLRSSGSQVVDVEGGGAERGGRQAEPRTAEGGATAARKSHRGSRGENEGEYSECKSLCFARMRLGLQKTPELMRVFGWEKCPSRCGR